MRVRIDGELDESPWYPVIGLPASGAKDHGAAIVPPVGATVVIQFIGGDREAGRVTGAHFGDDELPTGTEITEDGDKIVWRDGRIQIEVDARANSTGVKIKDQAADGAGVLLEVDVAGRTAGVSSALGVRIATTGLLALSGSTLTLNGRPVAPTGPPI
ncbi:MAG: hypothetical protein GY838_13370 [bacterium]|nr:hypothetical protein [bacterium]